MWKQYMKTPFLGQPPTHEHHPAGSPKRERGLSRVASLPTVKTPSATTAGWGDLMRGVNVSLQQQQQQQQQANTQYGGHTSYSRTHNHTDDLRSYEQAVLMHRAPLTLHLAHRRRGNSTSTDLAATAAAPPPPGKGNRASPAGNGSGSDRSMSAFTDDWATSSRGSPVSSGGSYGTDDASGPTFKWLPSQTLGPEYTKRPATGSKLPRAHEEFPSIFGEQEQKMQERGLRGVAERARRMSFPSGRTGLVGLQD
jgi:hypothetical protein